MPHHTAHNNGTPTLPPPRRTLYHLPEWKEVLTRTYGYRDCSLETPGLSAPVLLVANRIMLKRMLVSLPFSDEAGPVIHPMEPTAVARYFSHIDDLIRTERPDYVEIKGMAPSLVEAAREHGFSEVRDNFTFRIPLTLPIEEIEAGFSNNIRRIIKKSKAPEVRANTGNYAEDFFRLHQLTMKRLGTPPHAKEFFHNIARILGEKAIFLSAFSDGMMTASILLLMDDNRYCARYVAGARNPHLKEENANTFLFWKAIQLSKEAGYEFLDLGISRPDSGVWEYKQKWVRGTPQRAYYMLKGKHSGYIDPRNKSISLFSRLWKTLVPFSIANRFGPVIRGQIGK